MSEESPTLRLSVKASLGHALTSRPRLQLFQKQNNANEVLMKANTAISERRPDEALALYTHVLHELAPGHVSALLNRSLCYVLIGHYELAAMDAYRAALASHDMRDNNVYFQNSRFLAERSYLRVEEIHIIDHEEWTRQNVRYVGDGWTKSALASIVINDQPDVTTDYLSIMNANRLSSMERDALCTALEVRAIYRLSGALFLCGGGARYDALGLLDDAMANLDIFDWERLHFTALGNDIMADLTHEADEGFRLIQFKGNGKMSSTSRAERLDAIKASMRSRSVSINHKGYLQWNKSEPDLSKEKWRNILQNWVHASAKGCSPRVVHPDKVQDDWTPYVELVAEQDFELGELIMLESSIYNVTTSDGLPHSSQELYQYHFCNVCAALLITPKDHDDGNDKYQSPSSLEQSDHRGSHARTSSDSSQSFHHDFRFCNKKHMAPLCSETCASMHNTFDHPGVCDTSLEREILLESLEGLDLPSLGQAQRETTALHDLLLLRGLAYAIQKDKGLLHMPEFAFATAGINFNTFSSPDKSETSCHSWSFTGNIVKPISMLHRICRATRKDPFVHLSKTEGWILNIALAKIRTATRITPPLSVASVPDRSRHCAKIFDNKALFYASYLPLESLPDDIHIIRDIEAVRVGCLNPMLDMIRFAEPEKGETPNVQFEHDGGIQVYATVRIAKGDSLLCNTSKLVGTSPTLSQYEEEKNIHTC